MNIQTQRTTVQDMSSMKKYIKTIGVFFLFCLLSFTIAAQESTMQPHIRWLNYPSSLKQLFQHFKGKVIYIDIMASWCKPCLAELKEYEKTNDFFNKNDIVRLFVSIDKASDWKTCLRQLDETQLKGYFVTHHRPDNSVENNTFSIEVEKLFTTYDVSGNFVGLSIPQFIIVNKEGAIVEYKAKRPSNSEELKHQLEQYVK